MRRTTVKRVILLVIASCVVSVTTGLWACSVPVFRYALERWRPDPFEVVVFHRGKLTEKQQSIVDDLTPEGLAGEKHANVRVHMVDLDAKPIKEQLAMWKAQKTDTLPWMVVKYPIATRIPVDVWAGPLSQEIVKGLLISPLRQEVARLLLKGESVVWLLLEGGDKKKDDAAYKLLEGRLAYLEKELALPEIDEQDVAQGLIDVDPENLKLSYALLRLSRKDPKEKLLIEMLLGSEEDLKDAEFANQPMAFPIFGRGRALYALIGAGINNDTIDEACMFLSGPCSCQVKDMNPGVDLLTAVDWETLIDPTIEIDQALPPLMGLGSFAAKPPAGDGEETETAETEPQPGPQPEPKQVPDAPTQTALTDDAGHAPTPTVDVGVSPLLRNILLVAGISVIVVAGASFLLISRKQP